MTEQELFDLFTKHAKYTPDSGELVWMVKRYKCLVGQTVGTMKKKMYRSVSILGKHYLVHRVIWLMQTGGWPKNVIDHINGNPADNRWENLRDVPNTVNLQNHRTPAVRNASGLIGVVVRRNKYVATISHNRKQIYIGTFKTPEEASSAFLEKKRLIHEGCTI